MSCRGGAGTASAGPQLKRNSPGSRCRENSPGDVVDEAAPAESGGKSVICCSGGRRGANPQQCPDRRCRRGGFVPSPPGAFYPENGDKDPSAENAVTWFPPWFPGDAALPEKPKAPDKPLPKVEEEQAKPVVKTEPSAAALAEVKKSAPPKEPPPPQREFRFNAPPPGNKAPAPQNQAGTLSLPAFVIRQEESHRPARREKPSADENRRHLEDLDRKLRGE
jgi:hypothetical protein